jgi:hypothetical protein
MPSTTSLAHPLDATTLRASGYASGVDDWATISHDDGNQWLCSVGRHVDLDRPNPR